MSDRFELSFKNKVVRVWLMIMVPTLIVQIFLVWFTEFTGLLSTIAWIIFFIWLYFHKKKEKKIKESST